MGLRKLHCIVRISIRMGLSIFTHFISLYPPDQLAVTLFHFRRCRSFFTVRLKFYKKCTCIIYDCDCNLPSLHTIEEFCYVSYLRTQQVNLPSLSSHYSLCWASNKKLWKPIFWSLWHVVASLGNTLCDNFLCLVEPDKQQILESQ